MDVSVGTSLGAAVVGAAVVGLAVGLAVGTVPTPSKKSLEYTIHSQSSAVDPADADQSAFPLVVLLLRRSV